MRRLDGMIESTLPPHKNALWLDKGIAKYYRNGKWTSLGGDSSEDRQELEEKVDSLDKEVGQLDVRLLSMEKYFSPVILLNIGNSDEVKNKNLGNLSVVPTGTLFECEINYGFGVGRMLTDGGTAHVVTPNGYLVKYSISTDGIVSKLSEVNLDESYTLPAASLTSLGGIKKAEWQTQLNPDENFSMYDLMVEFNLLLKNLKVAGIMADNETET